MKQRNILLIIIPLSVFAVFWVGFSIYHNAVTSTIPQNLNMAIAPISSDFDTNVIDKLDKRSKIMPLYQLKTIHPKASPSAAPVVASVSSSLTISATPSAVVSPSQIESSGSAVQNGGI